MAKTRDYRNYIIVALIVVVVLLILLLLDMNYGRYCTPLVPKINPEEIQNMPGFENSPDTGLSPQND